MQSPPNIAQKPVTEVMSKFLMSDKHVEPFSTGRITDTEGRNFCSDLPDAMVTMSVTHNTTTSTLGLAAS